MKCDSCGQNYFPKALHQFKGEKWCMDCLDEDGFVRDSYEEAVANGEPWALPNNPELWKSQDNGG